MSKGGRGAGANVLMIKKAGNKRQEMALREAFKVSMTWFRQVASTRVHFTSKLS